MAWPTRTTGLRQAKHQKQRPEHAAEQDYRCQPWHTGALESLAFAMIASARGCEEPLSSAAAIDIVIALGLKAVFLVTTIVGITGRWTAILADTGATVLVTANAMRLLGWKPMQH